MSVTAKEISVRGIVQGVGFRPFVYRLATEKGLRGWVQNNGSGVAAFIEGGEASVDSFEMDLARLAPPIAHILDICSVAAAPVGAKGFAIRQSDNDNEKSALVSPDYDVCDECLEEMLDPGDRRYRYPFINCTNCGPRYSIVTTIPYDRANTTMARFEMCRQCRMEYENPDNRRFHAQPVACPVCGPSLALRDGTFNRIDIKDPISEAIGHLADGRIVAVKGIGGYHLAVDAAQEKAVARLRDQKRRDEKPFALMLPSIDIARQYAIIDDTEAALLQSVQHPITLVEKLDLSALPGVAPGVRRFGIMLPYTPVHHLLFTDDRLAALVMTSANISDDPIVHTEDDAKVKLYGIADYYLTHDRPIEHRTDDSIETVMDHGPVLLRRARGYTPIPILLDREYPPTLALGADLKNTFCYIKCDRAFVSQHIGDLKYESSFDYLESSIDNFLELIEADEPAIVAHDKHPDSYAARIAKRKYKDRKLTAIQHHHAHMVSAMTEAGAMDRQAIGIIFDGTGYGDDGSIWGGEFLLGSADGYRRVGHTAPLALPGGDKAIREPWRIALAVLDKIYGDDSFHLKLDWVAKFPEENRKLVVEMVRKKINSPLSHGVGRLFDAASALMGLRHTVTFEGQAAMELESIIRKNVDGHYNARQEQDSDKFILDFFPSFRELIDDVVNKVPADIISAKFHNTIAHSACSAAKMIRDRFGADTVVLSGGVFQNRYLSDRLGSMLEAGGFNLIRHSRIPPNDGGISLGQAVVAARLAADGN